MRPRVWCIAVSILGSVALACDQAVAAQVLFGYYSSSGTLISEAPSVWNLQAVRHHHLAAAVVLSKN